MLEVKQPGLYIFQSVNDVYGIQHLRPRVDYTHLVKRLIDGPFVDATNADGRTVLSAHKVAVMRLSEILGDVSGEEAKKFLDSSEGFRQIREIGT